MEATFLLQPLFERIPATNSVVILYLDRCTISPQNVFGQARVSLKSCYWYLQGGALNVIPFIVHITHFYYYKSI